MGGKSSTPKAPDYTVLAKQQAADQQKLLQEQTKANRPDQVGPYGSTKWTQDEAGNWTQNVEYDPAVKGNIDSMLGAMGKVTGQMGQQFQAPDAVSNYKGYEMTTGQFGPQSSWEYGGSNNGTAGDGYADAFTKSLMSRIQPQQEVDRGQMENKLRMQGLQPGTPAYDRAYQNLLKSQGDVNSKAALDGMLAASDNARQDYNTQLARDQAGLQNAMGNQQMNLATQGQQYDQAYQTHMSPYAQGQALTGMLGGAFQPTFQNFNTAEQGKAADITGAAQQQYAQAMEAANAKNSKKEGKGSSLGSIAGTVAGGMFGGPAGAALGSSIGGAAGGALFSDMALKSEITAISDKDAFDMMLQLVPHSWKWTGTEIIDAGVLAQKLQELLPGLVTASNAGTLKVNYTELFAILLGAFRHMAKGGQNV